MGIGELIFIIIFILFGLFNLVARLLISRARQRRKIAEAAKKKLPAPEEPSAASTVGVKQNLSEVRQILEGGPSGAPVEIRPSETGGVETYGGEERAIQEQYVSRLLQEVRPRDEKYQTVENLQEENTTGLQKQALPSLDVSISDQQLSGIDLGDYGRMDFQERVHRGGWERIKNLPPLKRAIVLSELLGKPRALKDEPSL